MKTYKQILTELSAGTLRNYVHKATKDHGELRSYSGNVQGRFDAGEKMDDAKQRRYDREAHKRLVGVRKATNKLVDKTK